MGLRSRNISYPGAQDLEPSEGSSVSRVSEVERGTQPAGCDTTMARAQEDGLVIWETLSVRHTSAGSGKRGEPELVRDAAQGVGGPNMSVDLGERKAQGPERAKAARAGVNFRRET